MVEDLAEKRRAFDLIMEHYGGAPSVYPERMVENTLVIKIQMEKIPGKQANY